MTTHETTTSTGLTQRELELQDALEYQMDIVLRKEDERLTLLRETQILK